MQGAEGNAFWALRLGPLGGTLVERVYCVRRRCPPLRLAPAWSGSRTMRHERALGRGTWPASPSRHASSLRASPPRRRALRVRESGARNHGRRSERTLRAALATPGGSRPRNSRPHGSRPHGSCPHGSCPSGSCPHGSRPGGSGKAGGEGRRGPLGCGLECRSGRSSLCRDSISAIRMTAGVLPGCSSPPSSSSPLLYQL